MRAEHQMLHAPKSHFMEHSEHTAAASTKVAPAVSFGFLQTLFALGNQGHGLASCTPQELKLQSQELNLSVSITCTPGGIRNTKL